jgi:hypothetical protein
MTESDNGSKMIWKVAVVVEFAWRNGGEPRRALVRAVSGQADFGIGTPRDISVTVLRQRPLWDEDMAVSDVCDYYVITPSCLTRCCSSAQVNWRSLGPLEGHNPAKLHTALVNGFLCLVDRRKFVCSKLGAMYLVEDVRVELRSG